MNETPAEQPMDVTTVTRDAALLDALGRGDPPPAEDEMGVLLAAWRADLAANLPDVPTTAPAAPDTGATPRRRLLRAGMSVAAALVGLAGGLTIAALNAEPDSPLWPITRVVDGDGADSHVAARDARQAIAEAREAVADSHYSDAARHLDEATALIARVRDDSLAARLRDEVAAVRGLLPGLIDEVVPSAPAKVVPTPVPGLTGPGAGTGSSSGPTPAPTASPTGGGILPLPGVSLPPSLLPSLPLPPLLP